MILIASENKKLKIIGCFLKRSGKLPPCNTGTYVILNHFANNIIRICDRTVFHRPHPEKETNKGAVKSVRRFLMEGGISNNGI